MQELTQLDDPRYEITDRQHLNDGTIEIRGHYRGHSFELMSFLLPSGVRGGTRVSLVICKRSEENLTLSVMDDGGGACQYHLELTDDWNMDNPGSMTDSQIRLVLAAGIQTFHRIMRFPNVDHSQMVVKGEQ